MTPGTRRLPRPSWLAFVVLSALLSAGAPARAQQLGQLVSPGPLSKAHASLEGLDKCERCHERGKKVSATRCLACHKPVAERIRARKGVHRDVSDDCVACHVEHAGRDAELRPFDAKGFDHAQAGFALDGRHGKVECGACHKTRSYLGLSPTCASCHDDVHKGSLGKDCASCHAASVPWKETRKGFDHAKTAFPLEGAHRTVDCARCHPGGRYKGLRFASCADCHADPHRKVFGPSCTACHGKETWRTTKVEHEKTAFPLRGRHARLECVSCHVKPPMKVRLSGGACASCHKDPHRGTFKKDCSACHDENAFRKGRFDHAQTRFALEGKHAALDCVACHRQPAGSKERDFKGLSTTCASCHKDPHAGQLGASCERCHGTSTFRVTSFQHPRLPDLFAGAHETLTCERCHPPAPAGKVRAFAGVPTDCAGCHKDPHLGQLGASCQSCHSVRAARFGAPGFSHEKAAFPLKGKHAQVPCASCHKRETGSFPAGSGTAVRYHGLSKECASCHQDPHLGQLGKDCASCHGPDSFRLPQYRHRGRPELMKGKHAALACGSCHRREEAAWPSGRGSAIRYAGLGTCASCHEDVHKGSLGKDCQTCHSPDAGWKTASRAFHKKDLFPLEGKHLAVPCASCHLGGVLRGTPRACYDCHWVRRQDDRYKTRLGNQCETCHRPTSWKAVTWSHASTGFPLGGAHRGLACESCHPGDVFERGNADCVSCHRRDFESARDPNHVAAGFPTRCELCHTPSDTSWEEARFDHAARYPLLGAHATQACAACHQSGVYQGTPRDCYGCHRSVYERTTSPSHALAGFGTRCETCHRAQDAAWSQGTFDHAKWPLVGAHTTQTCASCHRGGVYAGTSSVCSSCHLEAYQKSTSPNHVAAGFPIDCVVCHRASDTTWKQARFDHAASYALLGTHATQACAACHASGVYKGTPRDCYGCHRAVYERTTSPNHALAGFATACEPCHKAQDATWKQGTFDHAKWPLVGAHTTQTCASCHRGGVYAGTSNVCSSCHLEAYQKTTSPNHVAAGFPIDCAVCHKVSDATWKQGKFDHAASYALLGTHATQACAACHASGVYKGTPRDCYGCHRAVYERTTSPNHALAGFATTCETCHKAQDAAWNQGKFDHAKWPLVGAHTTQTCASCHRGGVYAGTSNVCSSCHLEAYQKTTSPNHVAAGFPIDCVVCHKVSDTTWKQGKFDHAASYALLGVHATQACATCHASGVYKGTPRDCYGCHRAVYERTTSPNHALAGFATACEPCHRAQDATWKQGKFDHAKWPLVGAHTTQTCASCHRGGVYAGTSNVCSSCHLEAYQKATSPNHVAAGFPIDCVVCHKVSDTTWKQGKFDHAASYALLGVHATQACAACHASGVYKGTPRDCYGCHRAVYERTTSPNHVLAGFATACETCHKAQDATWKQGKFDHVKWPLVGAHTTQTCASCHRGGVYAGTSNVCSSCHLEAYQKATNPNHVAAGFPMDCLVCHKVTDTTWRQGTFNHATYALVGSHATQPCAACHASGVYVGTSRDCYGCHRAVYERTASPNHVLAGFPTTCDVCHRAQDPTWNQGTFDHARWPLQGAHATQTCGSCHRGGVYAGTPTACSSCHLAAYQATQSPNHVAAGFPIDCVICHKASDTSWRQARFDHTTYLLVGAHATQACGACHATGVYAGTPRDCYGCHRPVYERTTDPNHVLAGFPTTCDVCHRAQDPSWNQGTFSHTRWPLQGAHATQTCGSCHRGGVYAGTPTACVSCHLPAYQGTRNPNHLIAGFPTDCVLCHKASDTSWSQGTFNHATYALVGSHATQPCAACHGSGVYAGTPRDCYGCHRPEYDATRNPSHQAAGFPTTCDVCHRATDTSWTQGRFDHIWFPITSGRHSGYRCADCHPNPASYQQFTCVTCHGRSETDREHRDVNGYRYDSAACYTCHPQGRE